MYYSVWYVGMYYRLHCTTRVERMNECLDMIRIDGSIIYVYKDYRNQEEDLVYLSHIYALVNAL